MGCPMSKLVAAMASLKATWITACFACARGDMLWVVLISTVLNLTYLGAKSQAAPRDATVVSRSHDQ
jgi:hypothetical protein